MTKPYFVTSDNQNLVWALVFLFIKNNRNSLRNFEGITSVNVVNIWPFFSEI